MQANVCHFRSRDRIYWNLQEKEVSQVGATKEKDGAVKVKCPCCSQRLFDMDKGADGIISIKCAKCGAVVAVSMHHNKYRCRRRIDTRT